MALCPFAELRLLPQNATQPKIDPEQFIAHTAVSKAATLFYWFRDQSAGTESTGYIAADGHIEQYMDTNVRADAQWDGNLHGNSWESWDNGDPAHTPWNDKQIESWIKLGVWEHQVHGIPVELCSGPQVPGFGYHELFDQWNHSHHACPGALRENQYRTIILPEIQRALLPAPPIIVPRHVGDIMATVLWRKSDDIHVHALYPDFTRKWVRDQTIRDFMVYSEQVEPHADYKAAFAKLTPEQIANGERPDADLAIHRYPVTDNIDTYYTLVGDSPPAS